MAEDKPSGKPPASTPPGRSSPILMPGKPAVSATRRVTGWIRSIFGGGPETHSGPPAPAPAREATQPAPRTTEEPVAHSSTLQLLPGRLQPVDPEVIQQEVRFLRNSGSVHVFTLGWEVGDPAYHITLDHPSIRPLHARMTFEKGHWMIESMSPIDPVTVNGQPVRRDDGPRLLVDGDEVQLGQVVFRFIMP